MEVDEILEQFGSELVTDLRESLVTHGVLFGGGGESKLSAKIRFEVVNNDDTITFNLIMPDYGEFVDKGRNPGPVSEDGRKSISEWVKRKGIVGKFQTSDLLTRLKKQQESRLKTKRKTKRKLKTLKKQKFDQAVKSLTFLIARKVSRAGYKGTNFFSETLGDGRLDGLKESLQKIVKQKVLIEIK